MADLKRSAKEIMRCLLGLFVSCVILVIVPAVGAASVDIGKLRALDIDIPEGWKLSAMVTPANGCLVIVKPSPETNAEIKLSVAFFTSPREIDRKKLDDALLKMCVMLLHSSVGENQEIKDFGLPRGYGRFCLFTDLSQVPDAVPKRGFKVVLLGILQVSDDVLVTAAIAGDDSESSVFVSMKKAVSSIAILDAPEKRPNKALVPTPASVTPAAGAPVAPDAGAAHL